MSLSWKRNDRLPALTATLQSGNPASPVDLTTATAVTFTLTSVATGAVVVNAQAATIVNAKLGQVSYAWGANDLATAGSYKGEFKVTWAGGLLQTFPQDDFIYLNVVAGLS